MKTNELKDKALDWAVARCKGVNIGAPPHIPYTAEFCAMHDAGDLAYSTDWAQGGPIIEREKIKIDPRKGQWEATIWNEANPQNPAYGPTPLIAAMRCYVASKLGDEVEIPDEVKP